jgi:hypothetical protein
MIAPRIRLCDSDPHGGREAQFTVLGDQGNAAVNLPRLDWDEADIAAENYAGLGRQLALAGDLFRRSGHAVGLQLVLSDGQFKNITSAADFAPVIVDRVGLSVYLDGKVKGSSLPAGHLNSMLRSEHFLGQFAAVDYITSVPVFLEDFCLSQPGFNVGAKGWRYLHVGEAANICRSPVRINQFLDAMSFATQADRTNAVAAALTTTLRNHWPGGKPIVLVTANKSHAGKETVLSFAAGLTVSCPISIKPRTGRLSGVLSVPSTTVPTSA